MQQKLTSKQYNWEIKTEKESEFFWNKTEM